MGCASAPWLAMSGVGHLTLVDGDHVSQSDLNRQGLYTESDVGRLKVEAAMECLLQVNPDIRLTPIPCNLDEGNYGSVLESHDVVIDGTDALQPRLLMNAAMVDLGVPVVFGGAIGWTGYTTTCLPGGPCFRCIWPLENLIDDTCATNGVFGPAVGQIGAAQASEAIRLILGIPKHVGRMLWIDDLHGTHRILDVSKKPNCSACNQPTSDGIGSS